ncbi:MAG TPA: response regulator [Kofleriaceae bacterium]|nr:response regulator [Kofleriaceae bacterium]
MPSGRSAALVIHGDGDVLDLLTRTFEAAGFEVATAVSAFRAQTYLESGRRVDVVVAPWDAARTVGGELYRWGLGHRPDLRNRFVFLSDEVPPGFDALVGGRCLAVPATGLDELVRVANAVVRRVRTPPRGVPVVIDRPALLVADDDPAVLAAIGEVLTGAGYAVFEVDGGRAATRALAGRDFDAIVADWQMHDGGGAELYRWIEEHKPALAARVVFLSESDDDDPSLVAPGRPMFRKGQDSRALIDMLRDIVQQARS